MRLYGLLFTVFTGVIFVTSVNANPNPYKTLEQARIAKRQLEQNGPLGTEAAIFLVADSFFVTTKSAAKKSALLKGYMQRSSTRDPIRVENIAAQRFSNALLLMEMSAQRPDGVNTWIAKAYQKLRETDINNLFGLFGVAQFLQIPEMLNACLEIHSRISQELIGSGDLNRFLDFVRRFEAGATEDFKKSAILALLSDWSRLVSAVVSYEFDAFITAIAIDPRDNRVAIGLKNGVVEVWSKWTDKEPRLVSRIRLRKEVSSVAFCRKEDCILTASGKLAQVWKLGRIVDAIFSFKSASDITAIAQSNNAQYIAIATVDGTASVFSIKNHTPLPYKTLRHGFYLTSLAFSPDNQYLATGSGDQRVKLWALDNLDAPTTTYLHRGGVTSLAFSDDGQWLVTGSRNDRAQIWRVEEQHNPQTALLLPHVAAVDSVAISRNGDFVATGMLAGAPRLWSTSPSKNPQPFVLSNLGSSSLFVGFSDDGRFLATVPRPSEVVVAALPDLARIDLATAHVMRYVIANDIREKRNLPPPFLELLERNPYALTMLFH